jgi:hypothetical protein
MKEEAGLKIEGREIVEKSITREKSIDNHLILVPTAQIPPGEATPIEVSPPTLQVHPDDHISREPNRP